MVVANNIITFTIINLVCDKMKSKILLHDTHEKTIEKVVNNCRDNKE